MLVTVYMRMAQTQRGVKVESSTKPNHNALTDSHGDALPTASFAVDLNVPDAMFHEAERVVAEVKINESDVEVLAEVTDL